MSDNDPNCIFCKIVKKEIPSKVIHDDEHCIAFNDISPVSPTHILIIPKKHYKSLLELEDKNLMGHLLSTAKEIAKQNNLINGFRTIINTGENGGQTVFHLHVHVLGGRFHKWPPG